MLHPSIDGLLSTWDTITRAFLDPYLTSLSKNSFSFISAINRYICVFVCVCPLVGENTLLSQWHWTSSPPSGQWPSPACHRSPPSHHPSSGHCSTLRWLLVLLQQHCAHIHSWRESLAINLKMRINTSKEELRRNEGCYGLKWCWCRVRKR